MHCDGKVKEFLSKYYLCTPEELKDKRMNPDIVDSIIYSLHYCSVIGGECKYIYDGACIVNECKRSVDSDKKK